jgi:hypothetical protein
MFSSSTLEFYFVIFCCLSFIMLALSCLIIWISLDLFFFIFFFCCFFLSVYLFVLLFFLYYLNYHLNQWLDTWMFYPNIFFTWITNLVFYKTLIVYQETIAFSVKRHHCFTILLPVLEQSVPAQSRNKVEMQFVPILFLDIWDEETPSAATLILFIQISLLILKKIVIILSKYKKNALEKRILIEDVQFFSSI